MSSKLATFLVSVHFTGILNQKDNDKFVATSRQNETIQSSDGAGFSTKHDSSKKTYKSSQNLFVTFSSQPSFTSRILETITNSGISKMWSVFFFAVILPEILRILFRFHFRPHFENVKTRGISIRLVSWDTLYNIKK